MNSIQITKETFSQVRKLTVEAAALLPAEQAEFRAVPELMSFRQLLLHILSSYETLMNGWPNGPFEWATKYNDENYPTLNSVKDGLAEATAEVEAWLEKLTPADFETTVAEFGEAPLLQIVNDFILHEVHHRGQLFIYLRLCGIVPPAMY